MALIANNIVQAPQVVNPVTPTPPSQPKISASLNAGNIVVMNKKAPKPKYVTPEQGALTPVKKKLDRRPSKYLIDMMTS